MSQSDILRLSLSLLLVVGLILGAAWIARRSGWLRSKTQSIRIVANQSVGTRSQLIIVEIENERLLLGVTPQQIQLLHKLPSVEPTRDFQSELSAAQSSSRCQSRE